MYIVFVCIGSYSNELTQTKHENPQHHQANHRKSQITSLLRHLQKRRWFDIKLCSHQSINLPWQQEGNLQQRLLETSIRIRSRKRISCVGT